MNEELSDLAIRLKIGAYHRHIFLCIGPTCCSDSTGAAAWKKLKDELKGGPILVVYPEGYWYSGMTEDRIDRFIDEQILLGKPIEEWIFARNPLEIADADR